MQHLLLDVLCLISNSLRLILQEYKFFLAFENSLCKDYITEKFWLRALDNNIVPVVMNLGNTTNTRTATVNVDGTLTLADSLFLNNSTSSNTSSANDNATVTVASGGTVNVANVSGSRTSVGGSPHPESSRAPSSASLARGRRFNCSRGRTAAPVRAVCG